MRLNHPDPAPSEYLQARLDLAVAERDELIATSFANDELLDAAEEVLRLIDDGNVIEDVALIARLRTAAQRARELAKVMQAFEGLVTAARKLARGRA